MIPHPVDELRMYLEREDRLQRAMAAALHQELLKEIRPKHNADQTGLMATIRQGLTKIQPRRQTLMQSEQGLPNAGQR